MIRADISAPAATALRAAMMRRSVGNHAARRYAERNLTAGQMGLYRLACQLLACQRGGVA